MSHAESIPRRRFYRNRDKAMVAGVCAGLADYFGFNLRVTRILAVISLFMAMPMTLIRVINKRSLNGSRFVNNNTRICRDRFKNYWMTSSVAVSSTRLIVR